MNKTVFRWSSVVLLASTLAAAPAAVLTNDTVISPANTNYDGQELVISNCVVTLDGPHGFASVRVAAAGTLTHTASSTGTIPITASVADEPQILMGTNAVTLAASNVTASSVVVMDLSGTITYTNSLDYALANADDLTTLQRTETSSIPDGAMVLVSYDYTVGTTGVGLNLTVAGNFDVDAGGAINADGRGHNIAGVGGSTGSPPEGGGGAHGGDGGNSSNNTLGGRANGTLLMPVSTGSRGGAGTGGVGGAGGGAIRLNVAGTLRVNGAITANGLNATNSRSGGGAGGSIWLSVTNLTGSGAITAGGGAGEPVRGGGGSGGCIAIYAQTNTFAGNVLARGGAGFMAGGAGTVYLRTNSLPGLALFDNGGQSGAGTPLPSLSSGDNVTVGGGAIAIASGSLVIGNLLIKTQSQVNSKPGLMMPLTLSVTNDAIVQTGGSISMDGMGNPGRVGPGAGGTYTTGLSTTGGGGGNAGYGGAGTIAAASGGNAYSASPVTAPSTMGNGGGGLISSTNVGGTGGGILALTVGGTLQLDGNISANGTPATYYGGGGGSGGSINLTAGTLAGGGIISASGGNGRLPGGGGGGGGRVAIHCATNLFTGIASAAGGSGTNWGGAGSVFSEVTGQLPEIVLDNHGHAGAKSLMTHSGTYNLVVTGGAALQLSSSSGLTVASLFIGSNSFVFTPSNTYSMIALTVNGDALIQPGGGIIGDRNGYPAGGGSGPGYSSSGTGAGHGGYGGAGSNVTYSVGSTYDTLTAPTMPGSGGGAYYSGYAAAGSGGSAIRLVVAGTLAVHGNLSANGGNAAIVSSSSYYNPAGGGSGGSLWITTGTLSGAGAISADGGTSVNGGGGGGGGRIAVFCATNLFTGSMTARGGAGYCYGGAGTIYTRLNGPSGGLVLVDNGGISTATNTPVFMSMPDSLIIRSGAAVLSPSTVSFGNLLIESNASLRGSSLTINLAGGATIQAGGGIVADGVNNSGTGIGSSFGTGGGHGGYGGGGSNGVSGGGTYGSATAPASPGSGGHPNPGTTGNYYGGSGGGLIQLTVAGTLTLDGKISANGTNGFFAAGYSSTHLGGGSGGGIALTAGKLAGAGTISANGGSGLNGGGGGGGGRVAVYYNTNLFTGTISAYGNTGYRAGGAGTIYTKQNINSYGTLLLDNNGLAGTNTPVETTGSTDNLTVRGNAIGYLAAAKSCRDLLIASNGILTFPQSTSQLPQFAMTGNATIQPGGVIRADSLGYPGGAGTGRGTSDAGGSHGGYGGFNSNMVAGSGIIYGSITQPANAGSGGASISSRGYGGGALRMSVAGVLLLDGSISANGGYGIGPVANSAGGGGSGGSIHLTAGTFSGTGALSANGGAGISGGGGGGGGRIAVYYNTNLFTGVMSAFGNTGIYTITNTGGAGTIYTKANAASSGLILVDNGGSATRASTPFNTIASDDLTIRGHALAIPSGSPGVRNLLVRTNGWLQFPGTGLNLAVANDATVELGGGIVADGTALVTGYGAGSSSSTPKGGGGHGGYGALNPANYGGVYGSILTPDTAGSQGGNSTGSYGGMGGGAIRLDVQRTLTISGRISSDGLPGGLNSGGGSGGSVWLTAGTISGNGTISANGGAGSGTSGGGGGGRIRIDYSTNDFTGTISAFGGNGGARGGAGTIYTRATATPEGKVIVDNGGFMGTNTPFSSLVSLPFDLFVQGGGILHFAVSPTPMLNNLAVSSGGRITILPGEIGLDLAVRHDTLLASGGSIVLDGLGLAQSTGPGAGATLSNKGGGGGYGGIGGASLSGAPGGTNYGSATQPVGCGSGGGAGSGPFLGGSAGGAALRLSVGGTLTLDGGTLSANGADGLQDDSGGGSGGSIWVMTRALAGTNGVISANGGWGDLYGGGGGGGGRIALYAPSNSFAGTISTAGGEGANPGQDGTIFTSSSPFAFDVTGIVPFDTINYGVSIIYIGFNSPLNPDTAAASDIVVRTPLGVLPETDMAVSPTDVSTLRVTIPLQTTPGDYSVQVGPQIENLLGTPMSRVFTGTFKIVLPVIQGTVTDTNGQPVAGVVLQPTIGSAATTDASGNYTLGFMPATTFSVTPSSGSLMFVPGTRTYTDLTNSVTGENYLAVPTIAPTVGGGSSGTNLWLNWTGMAGVTYQAWWSTNLADWLPYGDPIPGTNGPMNTLIPMDSDPRKFYRIGAVN